MIRIIIFIFSSIFIIGFILYALLRYKKSHPEAKMSFKESMDLTELPIVTFISHNYKLNFLLDTGSNTSYINKTLLPNLLFKQKNLVNNTIGIDGNPIESNAIELEISYKNFNLTETFFAMDLSKAFTAIKNESGVQVHGILGSNFFEKNKYILDFEQLVAYSKK